ncbi:hypothetical protein BsWGS_27049 [Bradybaena similaris]
MLSLGFHQPKQEFFYNFRFPG